MPILTQRRRDAEPAQSRVETQLELPALPYEQWLTAKELADHFGGLDEQSAYRWINEGHVPEKFIRYRGTRQYLFHPALIPHLEQIFRASHD